MAHRIARRELSSAEVVDAHLARIDAMNPALNAIVRVLADEARAAAVLADRRLKAGETVGPLHGVPFTIKENIDMAGLPTTWGVPALAQAVVPIDAPVVERMRAAGAIPIGRTNLPDMGLRTHTVSSLHGLTRNPWNPNRTAGGSSGGEAAALASGMSPIGLGNDIGGSLRVPAFHCGIYAHKPTFALVPSRGHTPPPFPPLPFHRDLAVIGPMARSALDLSLLLDVIAGPDPMEAGTAYKLALPPSRHGALKNFRVLVINTDPVMPTNVVVRAAIDKLAANLGKAGVKIDRESPLLPDFAASSRLYMRMLMSFLAASFAPESYAGAQAAAAKLAADDMSLAAERLRGIALSHRDWLLADVARARLRAQWRELFKSFDAVICPVMPTPAYPHDHSAEQETRRIDIDGKDYVYPDQLAWPGIATLPGLPATAIPIGLSPEGLPVGIQIVGPWLEDRTPLELAALIEREFGGFVPPPMFDD